MSDPEWMSLFRLCSRPGCDWHVLSDGSGSKCQEHGGNPIAAFRSEPEGHTTWFTRKELDTSTVNG